MPQPTNSRQSTSELTPDKFTNHPEVQNCRNRLKKEFGPGGRPFIVSDTLDEQGHQYVNLVQKGGGVLGVALVGYTYILEEMGIRFMRLAGTSAGAINTALMTVIGNKEDAKSTKVLDDICQLEFFKLVDGHPVARSIIKNFITHEDFSIKVKRWISRIFLTFIILIVGNFIFLGLQNKFPKLAIITTLFFVLTGFLILLIGAFIVYAYTLFKRLKNSGFGINPGDYFYDWIKARLIENGVKTVTDLNQKAAAPIPGLHLRVPHPEGLKGLSGDVTFIASELVTQNKIQFPAMCNLFRNNIDELQPAGFIRASMSIPIFFESYFINDIPCKSEPIKSAWLELNEKDPPENARFVDGGILSNFPINIFYKPNIVTPRIPSFGIDLDDSKPGNQTKHAASWNLGGYFGRIFNTIRTYYDKDFLLKNKVYEKGIGKIYLYKYNWLNFFLKPEEKIDMFALGAKAATEFLLKFDWDDYKQERVGMQRELERETKPQESILPQNLSPVL
jgi:NTE family protein